MRRRKLQREAKKNEASVQSAYSVPDRHHDLTIDMMLDFINNTDGRRGSGTSHSTPMVESGSLSKKMRKQQQQIKKGLKPATTSRSASTDATLVNGEKSSISIDNLSKNNVSSVQEKAQKCQNKKIVQKDNELGNCVDETKK